jgi:hypothetical protein
MSTPTLDHHTDHAEATAAPADPVRAVALGARPATSVVEDLYRNVHKGLRAGLFAATAELGSLDPGDRSARAGAAERVHSLAALLCSHAEHEDGVIEPMLAAHRPDLAAAVATDHLLLDRRLADVVALAAALVGAPADARAPVHHLYLELAAFTGAYLLHQDVEERVVMPALEAAVGVAAVEELHAAIVGSIPPEEMGRSLEVMLPAMNVEDRVELLEGMRATAPPEAVDGVLALCHVVLAPADADALARRLGVG